ncbi:MAG: CotH kinase family protein [Bacteroidetes bacterium]|nr:CotH kinase family protein [Bacteroidota bacterium]MBS1972802.1 CotH kinase family protein [Bacteroidota bacterium]
MKHLFLTIIIACLFCYANAQVNFTSSNLPVIVINTNGQQIADEPKITADMGIINNGEGMRNNITDSFNEYNGKIGIEVRGQSSQMFPMKSYSIELRDDNGASINKSLFGLPGESDWVMYAPYTDKTLMRNFLAYTMSNNLGHWAAHCRFAEVVLNGNYIGIYLFMEKIKRGSGRVNIKKISDKDNNGDAVTGGYIFSIDKQADGWFSNYPAANSNKAYPQFSYVYPKLKNITPAQKNYIESFVDSFENALHGNDFQDSNAGFRKYADENSFIDYFIVNEVSRNVDGYRLSTYLYKDRNSINSKIYAGPVWDYDLAFRNANYCDGSLTMGWAYQFNTVCPGDYWQVPFWWNRFMEDTVFKSNLFCRWKQARQDVLSLTYINQLIDSISGLLSEAQARHFAQWPILGSYIWPNASPIPTTYDGEISALKTWLAARIGWLDLNMIETGKCMTVLPSFTGSMELLTANPFRDINLAALYSTMPQTIYIIMVDVSGRTIANTSLQAVRGRNSLPPGGKFNNVARGTYFIKLMNNAGERKVYKLVRE